MSKRNIPSRLALAVFLATLPATASAQVWINGADHGTPMDNNDTIEKVKVKYSGQLYNGNNGGTGTIEKASIVGGDLYNGSGSGSAGNITTAKVDGGTLYNGFNGGTGSITTAYLNGGAIRNSGWIDELVYTSGDYVWLGITGNFVVGTTIRINSGIGTLQVGTSNTGTDVRIEMVIIRSTGWVNNYGSIGTVTLNEQWWAPSGWLGSESLINHDNAHLDTVNANGGWVYNGFNGGTSTIDTANISHQGKAYNGISGGTGYITTANVNDNGQLHNGSGVADKDGNPSTGYITTANIGGYGDTGGNGYLSSGTQGGIGIIDTANIIDYRGSLLNGSDGGTGTIGTVNINGGNMQNGVDGGTGIITTANVNHDKTWGYFGYLYNGYGNGGIGIIDTVSVNHGYLYNGTNGGVGIIDTANVTAESRPSGGQYYGSLLNGGSGGTGTITTVNISGGYVYNGSSNTGTITTANISDGVLFNGQGYYDEGTGIITTANVSGGTLLNGRGSSEYINYIGTGNITTANVSDGIVYNGYASNTTAGANGIGNITTANVSGGYVHNGFLHNSYSGSYGIGNITTANVSGGHLLNGSDGGIGNITTAYLNGGTIENNGWIGELIYTSGTYTQSSTGTIDTLAVAGKLAGDHWGNIGKLQFATNGKGVVVFAVTVDNMLATQEFAEVQAEASASFSGVTANDVDLTNGNIVFDLTHLGSLDNAMVALLFGNGVWLADLFDASTITGIDAIHFIGLTWDKSAFTVFDGSTFAAGWSLDDDILAWDGTPIDWRLTVPEPASLAVLGIGTVALLTRRRK